MQTSKNCGNIGSHDAPAQKHSGQNTHTKGLFRKRAAALVTFAALLLLVVLSGCGANGGSGAGGGKLSVTAVMPGFEVDESSAVSYPKTTALKRSGLSDDEILDALREGEITSKPYEQKDYSAGQSVFCMPDGTTTRVEGLAKSFQTTADGKTFACHTQVSGNEALYYCANGEIQQVSEEATFYWLAPVSGTLYFTAKDTERNSTLYAWQDGKATEILQQVGEFAISLNEEYLLYRYKNNLYAANLGGEPSPVAGTDEGDAIKPLFISNDGKTLSFYATSNGVTTVGFLTGGESYRADLTGSLHEYYYSNVSGSELVVCSESGLYCFTPEIGVEQVATEASLLLNYSVARESESMTTVEVSVALCKDFSTLLYATGATYSSPPSAEAIHLKAGNSAPVALGGERSNSLPQVNSDTSAILWKTMTGEVYHTPIEAAGFGQNTLLAENTSGSWFASADFSHLYYTVRLDGTTGLEDQLYHLPLAGGGAATLLSSQAGYFAVSADGTKCAYGSAYGIDDNGVHLYAADTGANSVAVTVPSPGGQYFICPEYVSNGGAIEYYLAAQGSDDTPHYYFDGSASIPLY